MRNKRGIFSLNYLFASFFGAFVVAIAFAYNNYRFSQLKFIDFTNLVFYAENKQFVPKDDDYALLLYNSRDSNLTKLAFKIDVDYQTLAIDISQKIQNNSEKVLSLSTNTENLLTLFRIFNIKKMPVVLLITKNKKQIYKQNSKITNIKIKE